MTVAEQTADPRFTLTLDSYQACVQVIEAVNHDMAELQVEWGKDARALEEIEAQYQRDYEECLLNLAAREADYAERVDHKVTAAEREALCHLAVAEMYADTDKPSLRPMIDRGRAKVEAHNKRFKTLDRIGSGAQSALKAHTEGERFAGAVR